MATSNHPEKDGESKNVDEVQVECYDCGVVQIASVHETIYENGRILPYTDKECPVCGAGLDLSHQVNT